MTELSSEEIVATNRDTYELLAAEYELKAGVRGRYNEQIVERFAGLIAVPGGAVLDLGCAVGVDSELFIERGFKVTGLEFSSRMAEFASRRCPAAKIEVGNFVTWATDTRFDAIFAQAFIHLFPKTQAIELLEKMCILLNPGGVAHLTTTISDASSEGWVEKSDYDGGRKRFRKSWTQEEMRAALHSVGFNVVDDYELVDPYDKQWMLITAQKPSST